MIRLRPRHVRTRLTLWYVFVLAAVLVIYAAGTSAFFFFSLRGELDASLLLDLETVEGLLESDPNGLIALRAHHPEGEEAESPRFLEVWSPEGRLLFRSSNVSPDSLGGPPGPGGAKGNPRPISFVGTNGIRLRMVTGRYFLEDRPLVIRLAHSEEGVRHEISELVGGIAFGIPITLIVAGLGG